MLFADYLFDDDDKSNGEVVISLLLKNSQKKVVKRTLFSVTPVSREMHLRGDIYVSYVITHNKNVTPHPQNMISNSNNICSYIIPIA